MALDGKPVQRLPLAVDTTAVDLGALKTKDDSPFRYFVKGERPRADGAFFELLLSRVFLESGSVEGFDEIWPRAVQALAGLNLYRLSQMSPEDLGSVIETVGGEFSLRLGGRASALQTWADAFWRIRQIYGSFRQYVRSFDTDGHQALADDLRQRLVGLSPDFLEGFLRESGQKPAVAQQQSDRTKGQQQQRTPKRVSGQPSRPSANPSGGSRRSQPHSVPAGKPATPTAPPAKTREGDDSKSAPKHRRKRRGFFRRRRDEGRGDKPQGQPVTTTATNQS